MISPLALYTKLALLTDGLLTNAAQAKQDPALGCHLHHLYQDGALASTLAPLRSSSFYLLTFVLFDKGLTLNPGFITRAQQLVNADIMEFERFMPQRIRDRINNKVKNITADKDEFAIMNPSSLSQGRLGFLQFVRLDALWYIPFSTELSSKQPFYTNAKSGKQEHYYPAVIMRVHATFPYSENKNYIMVDLRLRGSRAPVSPDRPPHNDDYMMTILLPRLNATLADVENIRDWWPIVSRDMNNQSQRYLDLRMPRFYITYRSSLDNRAYNKQIGGLFYHGADTNAALFHSANVSHVPVNAIMQRVNFFVNEAGLTKRGNNSPTVNTTVRQGPLIVNINRPFFFLVWHVKTQLVLFAGTVGKH